jgi:flavodoxin
LTGDEKMKIGIIVYSHTGNTLSVAWKIEQAIRAAGHEVRTEKVEPVIDNPNSDTPAELKSSPDVDQYDAVVFASPVHAFSLSRIMKHYLLQLPDLTGKKVHCFVTQQLKKPWMGGNRAVRQISDVCRKKGAQVISGGVVNWSGKNRESQIEDIVRRMSVF